MLEMVHLKVPVALDKSLLQQVHPEASMTVHEVVLEHLKARVHESAHNRVGIPLEGLQPWVRPQSSKYISDIADRTHPTGKSAASLGPGLGMLRRNSLVWCGLLITTPSW